MPSSTADLSFTTDLQQLILQQLILQQLIVYSWHYQSWAQAVLCKVKPLKKGKHPSKLKWQQVPTRWVFKDYSNWHSDLCRHEKPVSMPTSALKTSFHANISPKNWFLCRRRSECRLEKSLKTLLSSAQNSWSFSQQLTFYHLLTYDSWSRSSWWSYDSWRQAAAEAPGDAGRQSLASSLSICLAPIVAGRGAYILQSTNHLAPIFTTHWTTGA